MNTSCDTKSSILNGCNPTITILCILSCALCTIVMIWGVYAMRADMARMEQMMTPASSDDTVMQDHCRSMPSMAGCEKFR